MVRFVVVDSDEDSTVSAPATVTINFDSIDNPPVLDLNGPQQPGSSYSTTFQEGDPFIMVRTHSPIFTQQPALAAYRFNYPSLLA